MFSNDGATFFARRGNEFYELAGVMEPNFFPGVTARKVEKLEPEANWGGYCSRADFAVGVTDGKKDFAAVRSVGRRIHLREVQCDVEVFGMETETALRQQSASGRRVGS